MRLFLSVFAVLALACASPQAEIDATAFVDTMMEVLTRHFTISLSLPSLQETGEISVLFWKPQVNITADNGKITSDVYIARYGYATLRNDGYLALQFEVGVEALNISYDYTSEVNGKKGPSGNFVAEVGATSVQAQISLYFDASNCVLKAPSLEPAQMGNITVQMGGGNIVTNGPYLKLIVDMLTKARKTYLENFLDQIYNKSPFDCNSILPSLLAP